jgi:hypothetical protein
MLGKISLSPTESSLKMADAGFFFANGEQDFEPGDWTDCLKNRGNRLNR